ncbi:hypothetical protein P6F26_14495, partial [Roseibacterium sp. SDUM158017]|nr:hypothetical protein [Roseibacterium sp. SDUM158017]
MKGRAAAAGLACVASVGLHAAGLTAFAPDPPEALAGGPAQIAMIGNSFEDAVAGTLTPVAPTDRAPRVAATPPDARSATPPETAGRAAPETVAAVQPVVQPSTPARAVAPAPSATGPAQMEPV